MSDPDEGSFAVRVHEVVELHARGASLAKLELHVDAMAVDDEQRSALWLLAFSLRNGASSFRSPDLASMGP